MVRGKEGINKTGFLPILFILIVVGFLIFVFAGFELHPADPILTTAVKEDVPYTYNISLNFTGEGVNITQINITLPSGFTFGTGSNFSNFTGINFTSPSSTTLSFFNTTYWIMNGSMGNVSSWFAFNATAIDPGNYNITVSVLNLSDGGATNITYFNISVSVNDSTPPDVNVANFTSLVSGGNYSGTITLNASIADNLALVHGNKVKVYFNITNSSGEVQQNVTWATNTTDYSWNVSTFDTTSLGDGLYNVTIWANDTNQNMNNSAQLYKVRIDNTDPTGTMACSPTALQVGDTVTCTCTPSDGGSGINTALTSYTSSPSTTNTGTFTQTCSFGDRAGNTGSATSNSYTIELGGTGGSSGGGGAAPVTKIQSWSQITPETPTTMTNFAADSGVKEIKIEVGSSASNVKVTVEKYETTPSAVSTSRPGTYKYLNIETQNLEDKLNKATMKIQIEKSWITAKGITKDDVALFKYDETSDEWNQLTTTYDSEDDSYYYYTVELTSFSYFAIAPKEGVEFIEGEAPTGGEGLSYWVWIIIGLVVLVLIGGGIALGKKKK